ncbi:hypothetical protein Fcan01_06529 [Folsomia candida]|uniref:Uncharacterized protein n=1 Tax=Folsomia candida TaxID=158441 RepID=A0A226EK40_FOLCA|nr:hypothetical protein Fcan01_06529 [Folsomia candida]
MATNRGYGDKFCNKFLENVSKFTSEGQTWLFNTMTCLQDVLVPIANKEVVANCSTIETTAFNSHPVCYVNSPPGVCSLPISDKIELLRIIGISTQALEQVVPVIEMCSSSDFQDIVDALKISDLDLYLRILLIISG